jgi:hypothetical protein
LLTDKAPHPDAAVAGHVDGAPGTHPITLLRERETEPFDEPPEGGSAPVAFADTVLRQGAKGLAVIVLQRLLNDHGAAVEVDGVYGARTFDAVKAFQGSKQLARDGIVGPDTWRALHPTSAQGVAGADARQFHGQHAPSAAGRKGAKAAPPPSGTAAHDQFPSWTDWTELRVLPPLLGRVFFRTLDAALDDQDRYELDQLCEAILYSSPHELEGDRPRIQIVGTADPRPVSPKKRAGGNQKLAEDRADAVVDYIQKQLSARSAQVWKRADAWKRRITLKHRLAFGFDKTIKDDPWAASYKAARSATLVRVGGQRINPKPPAGSRKEGLARCRAVLARNRDKPSPEVWKRLVHFCQDGTSEDFYLVSQDADVKKEVETGGYVPEWSKADLRAFMSKRPRFRSVILPIAGPMTADAAIFKTLVEFHDRLNAGYWWMMDEDAKWAGAFTNANMHRKQLIHWIDERAGHGVESYSLYNNWGVFRR